MFLKNISWVTLDQSCPVRQFLQGSERSKVSESWGPLVIMQIHVEPPVCSQDRCQISCSSYKTDGILWHLLPDLVAVKKPDWPVLNMTDRIFFQSPLEFFRGAPFLKFCFKTFPTGSFPYGHVRNLFLKKLACQEIYSTDSPTFQKIHEPRILKPFYSKGKGVNNFLLAVRMSVMPLQDVTMASLSKKWNYPHPQRWATCFLVISPECIFLYLHLARCRTHTRRQVHFRTLGELLSMRENPFSDCRRPPLPPPCSNTLIIRERGRRMQDEELQLAGGAAPPLASISLGAPPYGWSRVAALLAGPATWLRSQRHDCAAHLVNEVMEGGRAWR